MTGRPFICFVGLLLGWVLGGSRLVASSNPELFELSTSGPTAARINLVVLAEGYRESERELFLRDAGVVADGILETNPLKQYAGHFNVFGVFVASQESGSDHPSRGILRDTYFNSTYDSFGIQRLVTIPPNNLDSNSANGQGKVLQLLTELVPEYDIVAIVVNDPEYGGSGGSSLVVSTHSQSREIAVHELGHTLAGLGDEYSSANPGYPDVEEPNTTRSKVRSQIKWNAWIKPSTPVPTPGSGFESEVGLFEGAHYHSTGWYRPKFDCKMKILGVPFCEVCSEALVLSIYQQLPQPARVSPASEVPVPISIYEKRTFELSILPVESESVAVNWSLNGVPLAIPESPISLTLAGVSLSLETNELSASMVVTTPLVRNDPFKRMQSLVKWKVVRDLVTPPLLTVELSAEILRFSWSASAVGFTLESSPSATSTAWTSVGVPPSKVGDQYRLELPPVSSKSFYRLRR